MSNAGNPLAVLVKIASTMPGTAWVFSSGPGEPTYSSRNFRQYFGECAPGTDLARWEESLHPEDRELGLELLAASQRDGEYLTRRVRCFRRDVGRYHWFDCCFGGSLEGNEEWALRIYDVDAQLNAEAELRLAQRRKDEFLAMLGHELRNPLATISNVAELFRLKNASNPDALQLVTMLQRQATQMTYLVDGLLEVSRVARGKILMKPRPLEARDMLQSVLEDRRDMAAAAGLELVSSLPEDSVVVLADHARLVQVIDNLLGNAIKFTDRGGTIRVSMQAEPDRVRIHVRDTGIGIPADLMPHIFEPFQQGRGHLGDSAAGLGLGLALAKGLVELHGGTLEARSQGAGTGSEFVIQLPLYSGHEVAAAATRQSGRGARVLIVDDDTDAAESLSYLLECLGHEVETAFTGAQALKALAKQAADIVLCDLAMPGMSGFDLLRAIRDDSTLSGTCVVALTGYGHTYDQDRVRAAGFNAYLVKPLNIDKLNQLLDHP